MVPILCVGEEMPGDIESAIDHVVRQVDLGLRLLDPLDRPRPVVAYEPLWAIGVGARPADPDHIGAVQRGIKEALRWADGDATRVIYGGSVDHATAGPILAEEGVDGLFVGRAALDAAEFAAIIRAADGAAEPPVAR
jgi:triosephosphate isomerase